MFSCILECTKDRNIPIIADGGIRCNGDIAKALVAGATMVMCGSIFAACTDSPANMKCCVDYDVCKFLDLNNYF